MVSLLHRFSSSLNPQRGARSATTSLRAILLSLFMMSATLVSAAATTDYLHTALGKFSTDVPRNWAYSLTIDREGKKTTEHFDPSKPPAEQWTLLRIDDRPATSKEQEKYFKYKARHSPGALQATFQKSDIEPGSIKLVSEDADRAEVTCTFREQSTNADKMLGHLGLRLTINKHQPHVEKSSLSLQAPYSPVLGVKMHELVVTTTYLPPTADRPSLPANSSSRFVGRIFFIPIEENIHFDYFDFTPAP